jgi:acetylornithine/succinyldiaminopimelate/putrescine aminotransferase
MAALAAESRVVRLARGRGLMQALVLAPVWRKQLPAIVLAARAHGLLVTRAGTEAVRLLPPLTCSDTEVDEALQILRVVLREIAPGRRRAKKVART